MEHTLKDIFNDLQTKLQDNVTHIKLEDSIIINKDFYDSDFCKRKDIRQSDHKTLFEKLRRINKPVLYWFTFDNIHTNANVLRDKYEQYLELVNQGVNDYRNCSALKTSYNATSNTLYVGKVRSGFWGRFITHLGYNITAGTAGLQLFYWYDFKNFPPLRLNYIILEKEMANLVTVLEMELANKLTPIIGKK